MIVDAAHEDDVVPDPLWLVIAPHADTSRNGVNEALATYKNRSPQSLQEWDDVRPLGLRLAKIGEVGTRRQTHSDFMYQIAMSTPDLGQLDHRYGEIHGITTANTQPGRRMLAESDHIFDQQQAVQL